MKRRIPPWLALLPLTVGVLAYWLYWKGEAEAFRAGVADFASSSAIEIGGFPYRIEAHLPAKIIRWERPDSIASLSAERIVVNRQPWRTGHVVIAVDQPKLQVMLPEIAGARFDIEAPAGLGSVRKRQGIVERLSMQFETAKVWLPVVGGPYDAKNFEVHVRETPSAARPSASPTHPAQAEARIAGTLSRPGGAVVTVEVPLIATAARRISSVAGWRAGGTVEIKGARLLGPDGAALAGFDATLAPLPDGRLAISGTIDTDCPETVRALLEGRAAGQEFRSRRARRMSISGDSGSGIALGDPEGATGGRARSQEPPCPDLRR